MNYNQAVAAYNADRARWLELGVSFAHGAEPRGYASDEAVRELLAMDAVSNIPPLSTDPNSALPSMLTTVIDPEVYEVLFAPNRATDIYGERQKGDWLTDTTMFPVAEATGEVSSYGDYANNGLAGVNVNWPNFQSYEFQLVKQYGEKETERMGLARVNWVGEIDKAAAINLNKFSNLAYIYGVGGLQNYGLLNDPALSASLTPATKAAGGTAWFSGNNANATANEVYNDILAVFQALVSQNRGLVDFDTPMTLAIGPTTAVALGFTNTFNVNVEDLLKKNFSKLRTVVVPQFDAFSATANTQGNPAGNIFQLIADEVGGQKTGFCSYNVKMRAFPIVRDLSAFRQKVMSGTWGTILRYPAGIASMLGV